MDRQSQEPDEGQHHLELLLTPARADQDVSGQPQYTEDLYSIESNCSHFCEITYLFFLTLQSVLRESRELHGDLEAMHEKVEILSETLQVEAMGQQVSELSRHTEELEQSIGSRLQSLQDAAKVYFFLCIILLTTLF